MAKHDEFIHGTCTQLLFSPDGGIEGALVDMMGAVVQVSVAPEQGTLLTNATGPGRPLRVLGTADRSPKTANAAHLVYQFATLADAAGRAISAPDGSATQTTIDGVVSQRHFARHGEPNGVVLASGEFIHLRPRGMTATGLDIGARVHATGELHTTALGTRMLEAHRVNDIDLD